MKLDYKSFLIFVCKTKEEQNVIVDVMSELLNQTNQKFEIINKEESDFVLLLNNDISSDIKDTCGSLIQDLTNTFVLEGFRISDISFIDKTYVLFKKHHYRQRN